MGRSDTGESASRAWPVSAEFALCEGLPLRESSLESESCEIRDCVLLLYVLMYDVEVRCNALRCSMHAIRYTIHTFHETLVVIPTKMNEGIGIGKYLVFVFVLLLV